jgi:hypothetical protein
MTCEDLCFEKAVKMVELGLVQLSDEMDIFQLTDLLVKLEKEKEYKNQKSDREIDYKDEIINIEEIGTLETMDISVSGDNLFYCNGILTKNSFGLPATADFMFALISTEELEQLNQLMVKQLKNRFGDPNHYKRFVIGVDREKMRLYDAEDSAQDGITDSGQDDNKPINTFGTRGNKFNRNFSELKV